MPLHLSSPWSISLVNNQPWSTEGFEGGLLAKLGILFNSSLFYHCPYDAWCSYNLTIGELKLTETKQEILHYMGTGDKRQKMIQLILIYTDRAE